MPDSVTQTECHTKNVNDWLLAILRYAVTLHDADKFAVLLIAEEIDKLESRAAAQPAFNFFRRTSTELCSAIVDKRNPKRTAVLHLHLKRINGHRLRRAFAAAIEIEDIYRIVPSVKKITKCDSQDLWEGLYR
jgi:hypothetical protein